MKDLSREEELRQLIIRLRDAYDKKKWVRLRNTFFALSGILYLLTFYYGEISSIKEFFYWLIGVPMLAGLIIFISMGVLFYIMTESFEEEKTIARLIGRLEGIEEAKRSEKM